VEQKPSANPLEIAALARQRLRVQNNLLSRRRLIKKELTLPLLVGNPGRSIQPSFKKKTRAKELAASKDRSFLNNCLKNI